jgi:hypothetical protein
MLHHPIYKSDISVLDSEMIKIIDNTKLEGVMQDEDYLIDLKDEVISWFKIREDKLIIDYSSEDICVIHVRGGDFKNSPAILNGKYYNDAMKIMLGLKQGIKFVAITDDINYCKSILPNVPIVGGTASGIPDSTKANHHIGGPISIDYSILNKAKYSIIANSSFSWWATWTNTENYFVIAPKFWGRYNNSDGHWSTGGSLTRGWNYLDTNGKLFTYEECLLEYNKYKKENNYGY